MLDLYYEKRLAQRISLLIEWVGKGLVDMNLPQYLRFCCPRARHIETENHLRAPRRELQTWALVSAIG